MSKGAGWVLAMLVALLALSSGVALAARGEGTGYGAAIETPAAAVDEAAPTASSNPRDSRVPGNYIVVLKDSVDRPGAVAEAQTEQRDGDVSVVYRHALKGYAATLPKDEVNTLRRDPRVAYVTPDHQVVVLEEEVELETEDHEGVEVSEATIPTGISRTFAAANKALGIDGKDDVRAAVDVAVLDTGIDYEHPDLDVEGRTSCITGSCVDNSGKDGHSHGTHVAGTIGAIDNGEGVVGMAPGARMWAVKVLNDGGSGLESWIIAGVDWVTAHAKDIEVANMSLGCLCTMSALDKAINKSVEAGVVYAVAAGNNGTDAKNFSPAKNERVITVSALADYDGETGGKASATCQSYGLDDRLASFSNFGATIEVAAPGVCILSTLPGNKYGLKSGTSMASPHVAGAAAILALHDNPGSQKDVEAIRETIEGEGNFGWTDTSKDGVQEPLLDVSDEAVFRLQDPPTATTQAATKVKATTATLNGTVDPSGSATSYYFEYGETESYGTKTASGEIKGEAGESKKSPGTLANDNTIGTVTWTNPGNAKASDGSYAEAVLPSVSQYLKATNFGFSLPEGATVVGVTARIEHKGYAEEEAVWDNSVKLVVAGKVAGEDHKEGFSEWPWAADAYQTYGGPKDLWGLELTKSDVESSGFGLAVAAQGGTTTGKVDHMELTVHYVVGAISVSKAVEGLKAGATYHYRLVAKNGVGTSNGEDKTFTTEESNTSSQLSGMAVTEPFNSSTSAVSDFSVDWSALGWASGSPVKGENTASGWRPVAAYPTVNGAFYASTATDTGPGIAAVATMAANPANASRYFSLWLDMPSPSSTRAGYELRFTYVSANTYNVALSKWEGGKQTSLASKSSYSFANGNSFALADQGGVISAWTNTGSGFAQLLSASDASFGGGRTGVEGSGNNTRLTNFKIGSLLSPVANMDAALKGLPVNDSFGTNESPLSGGGAWGALAWDNSTSGHNTGHVEGGWGPYDAYSTINGAYWQKTTFADTGAGDAVAATLFGNPTIASRYFSLWLDMPSPGSARTGYELRFTETSSNVYEVALSKWQSGSKTALASKSSYSFSTGSQFALVDKGGTVSVWTKTASEYAQLLSVSDSAFKSGYTGIEGSGNITRLKDFKGGPLAPF